MVGPTASGKSDLAIRLAKKYNGEIISADSRQVYRGMDIGTGKVSKKEQELVRHHLIDVADPKKVFNVFAYQQKACQKIKEILAKKKTPFLAGGTGLYLDAVTEGYVFSESQDNGLIRKRLDKLSLNRLLSKLKKADLKVFKKIDRKNRRRVQRALEIYLQTGKIRKERKKPAYRILTLGLDFPRPDIYARIDKRLDQRLKQGMVKEVRKLHRQGVSWKRLDQFGLEYRYIARYLQGKLNDKEMKEQLKQAIRHFAKRQITWFKRNKKIIWIKNLKEAEKEVKEFLE